MDSNDYVIRNAKRGVFFDIGANHGSYTKVMKDYADKIFAFEPHPDNLKKLTENTNGIDNLTIVPIALSNKVGSIQLFQCPSNPGGHSISTKIAERREWSHNPSNFIEVKTVTLDLFCEQNNLSNITCMKIDVEAAEQYVLEGAENTLKRNKVLISLETHQTIDCDKIVYLLQSYGYDIFTREMKKTFTAEFDRQYICSNY